MSESTTITGINFGSGSGSGQLFAPTGGLVGAMLQSLSTLLGTAPYSTNTSSISSSDPLPTGSPDNTTQVAIVTSDPTILLPTDYGALVEVSSVTGADVIGGGAVSSVAGATYNYTGGAGFVVGSGGTGSILSTATNAQIGVTGNYTVTATGQADTYNIDVTRGGTVSINALGSGNTFNLDSIGSALTAVDAATIVATGSSSNTYFMSDAQVLAKLGTSDTVFSGTGVSTIYAGTSDSIVATAGASTIFAGGSDTFIGGSGSGVYYAGTGSNVFIGGQGGGSDTIFTSSKGDKLYTDNSRDLIITGGGADSVVAVTVAATVIAISNSDLRLYNTLTGNVLVDAGANTTVDGSNSGGGNTYFAQSSYGNTTLVGASAGNDAFYVTHSTGGGATISIQNFQSSDSLNLVNYSAADLATANTALANGTSVTLSDGTTISFSGAHPTSVVPHNTAV